MIGKPGNLQSSLSTRKIPAQAMSGKPGNLQRTRNSPPAEMMSHKTQQAVLSLISGALLSGSAQALTYNELQGLTYLQVKGSGLANTCPVIEKGSTNLKDLKA